MAFRAFDCGESSGRMKKTVRANFKLLMPSFVREKDERAYKRLSEALKGDIPGASLVRQSPRLHQLPFNRGQLNNVGYMLLPDAGDCVVERGRIAQKCIYIATRRRDGNGPFSEPRLCIWFTHVYYFNESGKSDGLSLIFIRKLSRAYSYIDS